MKLSMKQKRPYWHRGTQQEWEALTPEQQTDIWANKPKQEPAEIIGEPVQPPTQLDRIEYKLDKVIKALAMLGRGLRGDENE